MSMEKDTRETTVGADISGDGSGAERAKNARGTTFRLIKKLMEQKWKLLIIFVSIIISSLFTTLSPIVMGRATDTLAVGVENALLHGESFRVN